MCKIRFRFDENGFSTEREVSSFYEPGVNAVETNTPTIPILVNEFVKFLTACGFVLSEHDIEHFDSIIYENGEKAEGKQEKKLRRYLVTHKPADFNRYCIVDAANADEARRVAKTKNYDPIWKPGFDKFRLSEFVATPIDNIGGMDNGCSEPFG